MAELLHHEGSLNLLSNMPLELSRHVTKSFPSCALKAVASALINKERSERWNPPPASIDWLRQSRSVKPSGDTAHNYGAETAVRRTIRSGDVSVSRHFQMRNSSVRRPRYPCL